MHTKTSFQIIRENIFIKWKPKRKTPKLEINKVKGIKVASVGGSITDKFKKTVKGDTIKIEVVGRDAQNDIETDRTYLEDGYVTVTPLIYDFTNLRELKNFKEIFR